MVFEFLAFSSDVSHWRKKDKDQDMTGISLRTIISNCVVQVSPLFPFLKRGAEQVDADGS
jgi:hypothetical protein